MELAKHVHPPASAVVQMHAKHITNTQTAQQNIKQMTVAHLYATLANAQEVLAKQSNARNIMVIIILILWSMMLTNY